MKLLFVAAAAVSSLVLASPAAAGVYGTLGMSMVGVADGVRVPAATARVGWQSDSWFGVELEGSTGLGHDTFESVVKVGLESQVAAYGVATYKTDAGSLFVRAGYGTQRVKLAVDPVSAKGDFESYNVGVGATLFSASGNGVRIEALRQLYTDDTKAMTYSFSYIRKFN